ncbi:MFS transporter [Corynebacterium stationis]|uniref:MFS transporter n=1 Tax=Corynebacterium stationis TaxID=1705 RepID=UPI00095076B5|nr:MFS transporter [Corynebacterium stationis]APT94006.1 MFS transporter [Corynebacterium stationis]
MSVATDRRRLKDVLGANFGNVLEWYDWNIYTIFAPYFALQFFAHDDPTSALLSTFAVFAVGFIARPVGGYVFGAYADKVGRKQSLFVAMMLTAAGSLLIGIAPTFDSVGIWASVLLVIIRLAQGLAHGGEMGTAVTYLVERAPSHRRALYGASSWISVVVGTMLATLMGLAVNAWLSESAIASWGWRVPFLVGGVLGIYAIWLRANLQETQAFTAAAESAPTGEPKTSYWRGIAVIFGVSAGGSLMFYTWLIYLPTHAQVGLGQSASSALSASLIAQVVFIIAIAGMGVLGDRIGRKPLVIAFSIGFIVLTIPLYSMLQGTFWSLLGVMAASLVVLAMLFGVNGAVWTEALSIRRRAVGVAATLSLATAIFGGTAPYLNTWLEKNGTPQYFEYYLIAVAILTLLTGIFMKETKDVDLSK